MPSCFEATCKIRVLAWCGMIKSMSSMLSWASSTTSRVAWPMMRVAKRKTCWPFIFIKVSPRATASCVTGSRVPRPTVNRSPPDPSEPSRLERTPPGSSDASSKTAPAPSPKSTQTLRSVQFITLLIDSVPMTRTLS